MLRAAWWLAVGYAANAAIARTLGAFGLHPGDGILGGMIFYGVLLGVVAVYARRFMGATWMELAPRRGIPIWLVFPIACVAIGDFLLTNQSVAICNALNVLSPGTIGLPGVRFDDAAGSPDGPLAQALVSRALLPAVFEEAVFRGLVLTALLTRMSKRRAIAISALLFASAHFGIERMPDTFLMEILYGWMCVRFRSLVAGMLAHFLHNSTCVVLSRIGPIPWLRSEWASFDQLGLLPVATVGAAAAMVVASVMVIRLAAKAPRDLLLPDGECRLV
jgi:membrane protease YdiL (CAAX protease family)